MEGSSKGLRKGAWTAEEDSLLRQCINKFGEGKWHQVPVRAGLNRCRKSCRLRWLNYLKPSIKRGKLSSDEVDLLLRLHRLLGNRWSLIAGRLPGRTANDVKNYWNTHLINNDCNHLNGPPELDVNPPCLGLNNNHVCDNSITYNKDEKKDQLVNNMIHGDNMWLESFLEESQEEDMLVPEATTTEKGETLAFDVDQLWSFRWRDCEI
ncbi:unnamed protein product [Arabidopsis arenosa]|uniref:Uncharacterized protein n=1 Tax=Arabidopsis arenosa TaxID=38785 RepID=A0A8S1ZS85_ARAAE|nr:unnamed protein product [Arabidopsis arenosa]